MITEGTCAKLIISLISRWCRLQWCCREIDLAVCTLWCRGCNAVSTFRHWHWTAQSTEEAVDESFWRGERPGIYSHLTLALLLRCVWWSSSVVRTSSLAVTPFL